MITLVSPGGKECDVTAKEWGFYLTPSINVRLKEKGFKVGLIMNNQGKLFINAVEVDKMTLFEKYLVENEDSTVVRWLDEWHETERTHTNEESLWK